MALKQANTLAPANTSATGFALGDARHIGGHRVVASLDALIKLQDWQLLNPGETDTALALGQEWYVKGSGNYRLVSWENRKATSGWRKVVDPNTIDTTLFQIVSALPTTGINKNKIYLLLSKTTDNQNVYAEYLYTGDTANYDGTKWEKLGEAAIKITVDSELSNTSINPIQNKTVTSELAKIRAHSGETHNPHKVTKDQVGLGNVTNDKQIPYKEKGANNGVAALDEIGRIKDSHLWDATDDVHGLLSAENLQKLKNAYGLYDPDTLCVKEDCIPSSVFGVLEFSGFTTGDVLSMSTQSDVGQILFNTTKNKFVFLSGGKQYGSWRGVNKYNFGQPVSGTIYKFGKKLYVLDPDSGGLVVLNGAITDDYIDTLF